MATLGDLVVNLTANSKGLASGLKQGQGLISDFALAATAAATAAAGIGLVKLAADAEQMAVKFETLLRSGTAAAQMMQDISRFAASTPFQKMEIADAAQKLLAFGVGADEVMDRLRQIGDISALTGNSIGELAELYGKARVQGRLFGEDINQLTGRGIPIIQELAKQFGVAESEVKKLVEAGKVSADNITQAFADMTAAGGKFGGGMEKLSRTTSGQFSTLKDNVTELGAQMGKFLLPIANSLLSTFTGIVVRLSEWGKALVQLGAAVLAATVAMRAITLATQAYARAAAFAKALSGPKGWIQLAIGVTAATGAVIGMNAAMAGVNEELAQVTVEANKAAGGFQAIAAQGPPVVAAGEQMVQAITDIDQALQKLENPGERINRVVREFQGAIARDGGFGVVTNQHPLVQAMREKEAGFTDLIRDITDQIRILRGEATETSIQLQQMLEAGVNPEKVDQLRQMFEERNKLEAAAKGKEFFANKQQQMEQDANAIKDSLMTPAQRFMQERQRIEELVNAGLLTLAQGNAHLDRMREQITQDEIDRQKGSTDLRFVAAHERGSVGAFNQIVGAVNAHRRREQADAIKEQTKQLLKPRRCSGLRTAQQRTRRQCAGRLKGHVEMTI